MSEAKTTIYVGTYIYLVFLLIFLFNFKNIDINIFL